MMKLHCFSDQFLAYILSLQIEDSNGLLQYLSFLDCIFHLHCSFQFQYISIIQIFTLVKSLRSSIWPFKLLIPQ